MKIQPIKKQHNNELQCPFDCRWTNELIHSYQIKFLLQLIAFYVFLSFQISIKKFLVHSRACNLSAPNQIPAQNYVVIDILKIKSNRVIQKNQNICDIIIIIIVVVVIIIINFPFNNTFICIAINAFFDVFSILHDVMDVRFCFCDLFHVNHDVFYPLMSNHELHVSYVYHGISN